MFQLSIIKDTVAVHPSQFGLSPEQAITNELNKKYANRVLHDVGLCICVFDLAEVGEGKVRYGDGCLWYKVVFRLTVFRPFASEVIIAKVKSSDEDGVRLTVGFFDDIYVPLVYLPEPTAFDPKERAHFWLPGSEATSSHELLDSPLTDRMYIDAGDVVRVRVESDEFHDDEPGPPKAHEGVQQIIENRRSPYTIACSMSEQGLGPISWWKNAGVETMEEG
ncbi:polymerase III polypeptide H [Dichomitus squalens]|uniref:Polymerase III polypeptide H n=1 Tax=Dichomitus squalens TaxID=114155 RepID=A0A4Q9NJ76_9APHY|nr:polymerase III polypeptide H [Dichomitus squalens]TBU40868.1 polymerase III polypeptide H [Dichomitus squalens]TBU56792.1 polymerase III polypeptide H [Dichomitus squalens]